MKFYLIQQMRGFTKEQILKDRERYKNAILALYPDAEFVENYFDDFDTSGTHPMTYFARSIEMMKDADVIVNLPGSNFTGSLGCELEEHVAQVYGIRRLIIDYQPEYAPPTYKLEPSEIVYNLEER